MHIVVEISSLPPPQGMAELLSGQAKLKYLNAAKEGKYRMLSKSKEAREAELQRQHEKMQSLQV